MGDYANYGRDLFKAAGFVYIAISVIAIGLALLLPKGKIAKAIAAGIVIALASILPIQGLQEIRAQQAKADELKKRYDKAKALFDERCKTVGEKIYRTVEGVEGLLLMKVRPDKINFSDQYAMDDPYSQENWRGDGYIKSFLIGRADAYWLTEKSTKGAYLFVESLDPVSKQIFYHDFKKNEMSSANLLFQSEIRTKTQSRYVVDWQDESTQTDRDNWIACGSVTVSEIGNKEVLGKRSGCMFDFGLGNTSGGRSPWAYARDTACPTPRKTPDGRAMHDPIDRNFVEKVIKPKAER